MELLKLEQALTRVNALHAESLGTSNIDAPRFPQGPIKQPGKYQQTSHPYKGQHSKDRYKLKPPAVPIKGEFLL